MGALAQSTVDARRTFHLTPIAHQCMWSASKQSDDTIVTQLAADFLVKNRTQAPVGLVVARVVKPLIGERWLKGRVLQDLILVRAPQGVCMAAQASGHTIPPRKTLPARVVILIRGKPAQQPHEPLSLTLAITDDDGNEQRIGVAFKGIGAPPPKLTPVLEAPFSISDPIEKEVVSVLQAELSRYDKCGRAGGGLGSVHIVYRGQAMTGVGGDSWNPQSPKSQSIADDPDAAAVQSDNLEAMLALYGRLASDAERNRFVATLSDRLSEHKGYLRVSYFIVCTLWQLGHFDEALRLAKKALPQGEINAFGLSNVLMLLNGLLRYRHPEFSAEMLDEVEGFIHGLNEHTFLIGEKITAIRAMRLRTPAAPSVET